MGPEIDHWLSGLAAGFATLAFGTYIGFLRQVTNLMTLRRRKIALLMIENRESSIFAFFDYLARHHQMLQGEPTRAMGRPLIFAVFLFFVLSPYMIFWEFIPWHDRSFSFERYFGYLFFAANLGFIAHGLFYECKFFYYYKEISDELSQASPDKKAKIDSLIESETELQKLF